MAFIYMLRSGIPPEKFASELFFTALYLSNDMEEDSRSCKTYILRWFVGIPPDELLGDAASFMWDEYISDLNAFLEKRTSLWKSLKYRCIVSHRACCHIMDVLEPDHVIWKRERITSVLTPEEGDQE
eukprot:Nk52_evm28s2449 gene=Nk52_evmTU28s2449